MLEQLITDVNIAVAAEAVQAIGNLARGLRKDFSGGSRLLLPALLVSYFVSLCSGLLFLPALVVSYSVYLCSVLFCMSIRLRI
jgi:hypothetical protein